MSGPNVPQSERDLATDVGLAVLYDRTGTGDGAQHCEAVTATDG